MIDGNNTLARSAPEEEGDEEEADASDVDDEIPPLTLSPQDFENILATSILAADDTDLAAQGAELAQEGRTRIRKKGAQGDSIRVAGKLWGQKGLADPRHAKE